MSRLVWDQVGQHIYETGVDQAVLYPYEKGGYQKGVAWNGVSNITESPSGGEATEVYADNIKYLNLISAETFGATIEAYTYPEEFEKCDGSAELAKGITIGQQPRSMFGLCYRTIVGNDTELQNCGYKLHLVYGCTAAPSEKSHGTVNESPEAGSMSWEIKTTPTTVIGHKPTATLTIDSTKTDAAVLKELEDILYGTEEKEPRLLLPDEVVALIPNAVINQDK